MTIDSKGITIFKEVKEDWYGNYNIADDARYTGKYVSIRTAKLADYIFRVCVWGNDDFGMERDYESEDDALLMFRACVETNELTKRFLIDHNFVYC